MARVRIERRKGENVGGGVYWSSGQPVFVNLFRGASTPESPFVNPATSAVEGLPPGQGVGMVLRRTPPRNHASFTAMRPGRYVVSWTGDDIGRLSLSGGAGLVSTAPHRLVFEVDRDSAQSALDIMVVWHNDVQRTAACSDFSCVHEDDLPLERANTLFSPFLLRRFPSDLGVVRPVHLLDVFRGLRPGLDHELTPSQALVPDTRQTSYGLTYDCAARLAQAARSDLWLNCNVALAREGYRAIARSVARSGFTGRIVLEAGLECWNYAFPYVQQSQFLRRTLGPGIAAVDPDGRPSNDPAHVEACAYAEKSMQLWDAFAEEFPRERLVRVLVGQTAWFDRFAAMYAYRRRGVGPRAGELMDAHAIAGYAATESPDATSTAQMWAAMPAGKRAAWWSGLMRQEALETLDRHVRTYQAAAARRPWSRNPVYCIYEGSHHVCFYPATAEPLPYRVVGADRIEFADDVRGRIATGDLLESRDLGDLGVDSPRGGRAAWIRLLDSRRATLHGTPAHAAAGRNALRLTSGGAPRGSAFNASRPLQMRDSFELWRFSDDGVAFHDDWWRLMARYCRGYVCVFEPVSTSTNIDGMWQFTRVGEELHAPDSPLTRWWKSVR